MKKLLLIEDEDIAFSYIKCILSGIGYGADRVVRCNTLGELDGVVADDYEIVITDLSLPDSVYPRTFEVVKNKFPYTPIIVLTVTNELSVALGSIQLGAQDYMVKGEFNEKMLGKSIQYAIERKKISNDYKRLFNDSPTPMYIYDIETYRFLSVNYAALNQYGYTRDEFLSMSAADIRPKDDVDAFYQYSSSMNNDYFNVGQRRHLKKGGEVFYVHIYTHNTYFEGREARIVLATDVDQRVKTEIALKEKSDEVTSILESITDGFFTLDHDWKFQYVNKESEKALKHKRKDLIGRHIKDILPEVKSLKFYSECKKAVIEKSSVHFEEYFEPLSKWFAMNAYPSKEGLAVYFTDITEQKKALEKIFIEKQNLYATINNTKDIIWSVNKNFEIMSANDAFWDRIFLISGKQKREVQKVDFDKDLFDVWISYYERAFGDEAFKIIWTETAQGKVIYEEVSFNPIYDKDRCVIGVSCFSRDITAQRNYMDVIEKQNEQLRKIAWVQSHEVRSPVASILGLAQLFNHEDTNDPFNIEILKNISVAATHLDSIIKKINAYARAEE